MHVIVRKIVNHCLESVHEAVVCVAGANDEGGVRFCLLWTVRSANAWFFDTTGSNGAQSVSKVT